ncbi:unnamed protein product, partial [Rotaria sordida]
QQQLALPVLQLLRHQRQQQLQQLQQQQRQQPKPIIQKVEQLQKKESPSSILLTFEPKIVVGDVIQNLMRNKFFEPLQAVQV